MKDIGKMCMGCMEDNPNGGVCPHCGFDIGHHEVPAHHLKPGTILNGKYYLGKALGEGGFGITYIGWDLNLEMKVAIKEYFPNGFVSRDVSNTDTVTIFSGNDRDNFENGKNKFINEAKALAKFDNLPGIVSVKDFFLENGTAYISMEFVEGETLKSFLGRNGGRLDPDSIFTMMQPLMKSLIEVHKTGIIHRDISPDNIMITRDSTIKLLDFGAARDISADGNKSLSIQLKPGYAPEEQYRTHGKQGPWTDVYALSATIYRAITGTAPVESLERIQGDTLVAPSSMGVNIDPVRESAIMCGMAVFARDRFQNIEAFYNAVYSGVVPTPTMTPPANNGGYNVNYDNQQNTYNSQQMYNNQQYNQQKNSEGVKIALIAVVTVIIIAIIAGIAFFMMSDDNENATDTATQTQATEQPVKEFAPPVFNRISASSTRGADYTSGVAVNYYPEYAFDGDYTTAWSSDRNIELTPTITLTADTKQHVSGVKIANGYFKSETTYTKNRRITKILVEYEGGSKTKDMDINMYRIMQDVVFDTPVDTSYIKIHVLDTHYGDWKDIAISEIEVY